MTMTMEKLEEYCFDIINTLVDKYGLNAKSYKILVDKVRGAKTEKELKEILSSLEDQIVIKMKEDIYG